MTILISNGNFLIADKRATREDSSEIIEDDIAKSTKVTVTNYRDDICKVFQPKHCLIRDLRVRAFAFAGTYSRMLGLIKMVARRTQDFQLDELIIDLNTFGVFRGEGRLTMLAIAEDGSTWRFKCGQDATVQIDVAEAGEIMGAGGSSLIYTALAGTVNKWTTADTALNFFLAGAYNNKGCSTIYDAYSLQEDRIVRNCRPSDAVAKSAFYAVREHINPMTPTKRHYNPPIKD